MWIAREQSKDKMKGRLFVFPMTKPVFENGHWWTDGSYALIPDTFPEVTFENSPQEVELKLKETL